MRVLLIDDHALVRRGLEELLQSRGIEVIGSAGSGEEGIELATSLQPDIILLDIKMPGMNGLETLSRLRELENTIPVLMLSMSRDEEDLARALRDGARGYLLKDMNPDELIPALNDALAGQNVVAKELVGSLTNIIQGKPQEQEKIEPATPLSELTPREQEILEHIAGGESNKVIARHLGISDGTVKLHVKAILRKLGVHSRVEAAVIAVEHGYRQANR
ncbi:response regulator [Sulfuriflexus sp.]|uniref:response regulator n=1 Tax=Sulfuriflexus sp. TaxID=2015443 RepID=UPI0028CDE882|nr:response regulator [Sulfuriflexus sp.]MDT8403984.1 response regulator [Sulfuriflexus sp.]